MRTRSNFFEAWESLSVVIFRKEAGCPQPRNTGIPEAGESHTKGNSQPYLTPPCPPPRSIGQSRFCSRTVMHSFRFTVRMPPTFNHYDGLIQLL